MSTNIRVWEIQQKLHKIYIKMRNGNKIHAFPSFQGLKPAYCVMKASTGAMQPNGDGLPGLQSH